MRVMAICREYRVKTNIVYRMIYDLEVIGKIKPTRKHRNWLELRKKDVQEISKELEKRGYSREKEGVET